MEGERKKRNVIIVSAIVGCLFFILHAIITYLTGRFNVWYSVIGAAIFFVLYFIFQLSYNMITGRKRIA